MKNWPSTIGKYVLENSRLHVIQLCDTKGGTMFTQWLTFSVWQGILSAVFHCCAGQASSPPTDQLTKVDLGRFNRLRPWWTTGLVWTKGKKIQVLVDRPQLKKNPVLPSKGGFLHIATWRVDLRKRCFYAIVLTLDSAVTQRAYVFNPDQYCSILCFSTSSSFRT